MNIILLIALLAFIVWGLTQIWFVSVKGRAPWIPSPKQVRLALVDSITLDPGQTFAELGAGSGLVARKLAKKFPTNQIYAYEISYLPFVIGTLMSGHYPNLNFIRGDIIKADLSMVDSFYIFTNKQTMDNLAAKLRKHPKPALLYGYSTQLPNFEILKTIKTAYHPIYVYKI